MSPAEPPRQQTGRLLPDDVDWVLLQAYYAVLNEHEPFRKALYLLFDGHRQADFERGPLSPSEHAGAEGRVAPSHEVQEAFRKFAAEWKLPERAWSRPPVHGIPDLYESVLRWQPDTGGDQPDEIPFLVAASRMHWVEALPVSIDLHFSFDPTSTETEREAVHRLQEQYRKVRSKIREAAEVARREGWSGLGPAFQDPPERKRLALRLFRRVVLDWTWEQVAAGNQDLPSSLDPDQKRSAMDSTRSLAKRLGVPLPEKRGRRPKSK